MAEIKAHEFAALSRRPEIPYRIVLIFGADRGLVSERAAILARQTGIDLSDDFAVIRLDASSLAQDAGLLIDEAKSVSLFGGERLIWVRNAAGERGLVDAVRILAAEDMGASRILIEAGDLKKTSVLRKTAAEAKTALAIPCYADDGRAIQSLIDEELGEAGLAISGDARRRLTALLGGDRLASRGELRKLALYCHDSGQVTEDDVLESIGDVAALSVDDAVDAVLAGDVAALDRAMDRIENSKLSGFLVLRASIQQLELLDQMRARVELERQQPAAVMAERGRGIHFRRKPLIERALRHWQLRLVRQEMARLADAVFESRSKPALENRIVRHALMRCCLVSARLLPSNR